MFIKGSFIKFITDRNDAQGNRTNYQQNHQTFNQQPNSYQRYDSRQGQGHGRGGQQSRFNQAAPPASYNQHTQHQQSRNAYSSGPSQPYQQSRPPHQQSGGSGGYQQWKTQRGGFQGQRGGNHSQQSNRGGYQRFNSNSDQQQPRQYNNRPDKAEGAAASRYGGSYSRD